MDMLILGVIVFIVIHLIPTATPNFRNNLVSKFSKTGYLIIFSMASLISFYFIIDGWNDANTQPIYSPSIDMHKITAVFVLIGLLLMSATGNAYMKNYVRHPQLAGLLSWAIGHLISNGEIRSLILFGGIALYSLLAINYSNKRDGDWIKSPDTSATSLIRRFTVAAILFGLIIKYHASVSGVSIMI